jgi:DNA-binding GntR family transcriptional regulator
LSTIDKKLGGVGRRTMRYDTFKHSDSLTLKVAGFLREAIVQGELKHGERLNELLISSKLNISRSPIREAFRILESENLVEIRNRRGAFVKSLSPKEAEEISEVISMLEQTAVRRTLNHLGPGQEKELKSIIGQLEGKLKAREFKDFLTFSMRLHHFIVEASGNGFLIKIYEDLQLQYERMRRELEIEQDEMSKSLKEHLAIARALLKRDGEETERLLMKHMEEGTQRVLKHLSKNQTRLSNSGRADHGG